MGRMEIITHTERRRRHSEAMRVAILAMPTRPVRRCGRWPSATAWLKA